MSGAGNHLMHFEKMARFPVRNLVMSLASQLYLSPAGTFGPWPPVDIQPAPVPGVRVLATSSAM